jgi:acyl transferase domain-containing protein/NADPH:quinone reductase-like Zn-dependent oxidoreductase/NAD(P)-dependent dehydrogenase (short-subunit alcohol dehydrogenase family)/acyl carrier protein
MESIAIIGFGCRFPKAKNPEAFWQLLRDGVNAITEIPPDRWDVDAFYDPDPATPGKMNSRWGGFLSDVDHFDPYFFGIAPREAAYMDVQQRLLLEVAWEALENASQSPARLDGSQTGVFIGISGIDYLGLMLSTEGHIRLVDAYSGTGISHSIVANRLSYLLNLRGPSLAIDTACSSSLVAVHLACESLQRGETNLALAGGVNLILSPEPSISFSLARMLSPDGLCKAFDASANGYVRGEGCGMVILKRLSDALRDKDYIVAVVRGSAVNQDGRSNGLTAPNGPSQQAVIHQALKNAGVAPAQISFVEAHGTGTPLGDPIEFQALQAVLKQGRAPHQTCVVGSVKTNIGHLESASGIAGLIKVLLAFEHGEIPPHLHLQQISPHISFDGTPLEIATQRRPWPRQDEPRFAGVSSFGFGGTNAHVVLEEPPLPRLSLNEIDRPLHVLTLSAKSENALKQIAHDYESHLASHPDENLADFCFSANTGKAHFSFRLAAVAESVSQLRDELSAFAINQPSPRVVSGLVRNRGTGKLAFLFTGQGAQYPGMGKRLYETQPAFRAALNQCARLFDLYLDKPLLSILYPASEDGLPLNMTAYVQPALFALEYALAAMWQSWGIRPHAVLGHSVGEYVAACVAGAISLEDAIKLIVERARLMQALPAGGMMAAVFADETKVAGAAARYPEQVSIAAINGPDHTVISGASEPVLALLQGFAAEGISARRLAVSHAFHSPLMNPMLDEFEQMVAGLRFAPLRIPLISNVTGRMLEPGHTLEATYCRRHVRETVRFSAGIAALAEQGFQIFLELGPGPTLLGMGRKCMPEMAGHWLASLRKGQDEWQVLLKSLAQLYTAGADIDWSGFDRDYQRHRVPLPTYPFERERYWFTSTQERPGQEMAAYQPHKNDPGAHPLLGRRRHSAQPMFESHIRASSPPYLADHKVQGAVLLPATAYVEMALAAATEVFAEGPHTLTGLEIQKAFVLHEGEQRFVQVMLSPDGDNESYFQVYSQGMATERSEQPWTLHATGKIHKAGTDLNAPAPQRESLEEIIKRCPEEILAADFYLKLKQSGLEYGGCFQGISRIWRRDAEALAELRVPEALQPEVERYRLHPAILDACLQALAAAVPVASPYASDGALFVPISIGKLQTYGRLGARLWSHARFRPDAQQGADHLRGEVRLLDEDGRVVVEVTDLVFQRLDGDRSHKAVDQLDGLLYEIHWHLKAAAPRQETPDPSPAGLQGTWLIFADEGGIGHALASLLTGRGERAVMVFPGAAFERLDADAFRLDPTRPEDAQQLVEQALWDTQCDYRGVIHLWSLNAVPVEEQPASLPMSQTLGCISVLHLLQSLVPYVAQSVINFGSDHAPRLWLVTRQAASIGAHEPLNAIAQAPLWGLGRVIAREHPELRCTNVDLGLGVGDGEIHSLFEEFRADGDEDLIALRGDSRYVARLVRHTTKANEAASPEDAASVKKLAAFAGRPFQLVIPEPGVLDHLFLQPIFRSAPSAGEVEIHVRAVGLNFRDVLKAMGIYPTRYKDAMGLGDECVGVIVAVGEGVEGLQVGDEVIAIAPACFSSYVRAAACFVVPKPAALSFEEAVTIPIAFMTAYYALCHLGQLSKDERVLIHAAAGGVGLAALQIARWRGAEVFATAGSPDKRAYLRSLGVKHVMDSRSLAFADEVMELTDGKGVDVVLNCLAGEAISKSLSVLGAYGRFLEIGKRDIYQNSKLGLSPFQNNLSFFAIDMDRIFRERPAFASSMFREIMSHIVEDRLRPLPVQTFPMAEVVSAFRYMLQAKNIGKIVVTVSNASDAIAESADAPGRIRSNSTYLITGGLGSLGLQVAQWMIRQGARHIVLMGRSGASSEAEIVLSQMREAGVQVVTATADVAQASHLADLLAEMDRSMPPLRGIVHAAGILDDGILFQLDQERFQAVMAAKLIGAWNLHAKTLERSLDFFVLFSSAASVFGSLGQGNYAAANAFLDALAHYRRSRGLTASSINWGPWAEGGMAARANRGDRLAISGIASLAPDTGLKALESILSQDLAQVCVMPIKWEQWFRQNPASSQSPLLANLVREYADLSNTSGQTQTAGLNGAALLAAGPDERRQLMESYVQQEVAHTLGIDLARLDSEIPLDSLGLDSLMAIELKNRIETNFGINLPLLTFADGSSVSHLSARLLDQLEKSSSGESGVQTQALGVKQDSASSELEAEDLLARIDELSDSEVHSALSDLLTEF